MGKERENAMQHATHVFTIWKYMDSNFTIEGVLERSFLAECIELYSKTKQPGTIQSYLGPMRVFIQYLLDEDVIWPGSLVRALRFKDICKSLQHSYSQEAKIRRTEVETNAVGMYCLT